MLEDKTCPLLAIYASVEIGREAAKTSLSMEECRKSINDIIACSGSKCAWWTTVYSTEGFEQQGCAVMFMPMMNANGNMAV